MQNKYLSAQIVKKALKCNYEELKEIVDQNILDIPKPTNYTTEKDVKKWIFDKISFNSWNKTSLKYYKEVMILFFEYRNDMEATGRSDYI